MNRINIIGAGLAGLSAAVTLAESGVSCNLISKQTSERAQSVLAEGGINAAMNTMGEEDAPSYHFLDTMAGGVWLADPNAVRLLTDRAPEIVTWLKRIGVPFQQENGVMIQRNFGGQKKKRTAYAKSSTGKVLVSALIDETRRYEAQGLIRRYPHHEMIRLLTSGRDNCLGVRVRDCHTDELFDVYGWVILATGGMNGIFPGMTTGTVQNTGDVTATVFSQGVKLSNLEMLQYHPTTIGISGKRCLVTEAARGEGGRLYIMRNEKPWYFMEEKYPELKNLMPRDVVSREMYFVARQEDCGDQVYLDMTGLPEDTWQRKLSDLREEIIHYLNIDPKTQMIPVEPGIHYFMGGIDTDIDHRTNFSNLYASGECTSQYHGANRLGGNSLLGAVFGGKRAAEEYIREMKAQGFKTDPDSGMEAVDPAEDEPLAEPASDVFVLELSRILLDGLGIVRNEAELKETLGRITAFAEKAKNQRERNRIHLARAMVQCALERRESRGAHYREDYPKQLEEFRKKQMVSFEAGEIGTYFVALPEPE